METAERGHQLPRPLHSRSVVVSANPCTNADPRSATVMALTTYILLSALHAGKAGTFDPRILGQTASKAFGLLFLEFLCIKLGCYLLGIGEEGAVVDLIAYEGYKFVG